MVEVEQKSLSPTEISKKLLGIIDGVLATGDWENSVFLKAAAVKLQGWHEKVAQLFPAVVAGDEHDAIDHSREVPPGYIQIFILLYQVDGNNLEGWYRVLKALVDFNVTRSAYKEEAHAREFVRSKVTGAEKNGYLVVNVKIDDFYGAQGSVDVFGHQLFALKEKALKVENMIEFVHANKMRYAISSDGLKFLGKVE